MEKALVLESVSEIPFPKWMPDFLLRRLIRKGLAAQLHQLYSLSTEQQLESVIQYMQNLKLSPVIVNAQVFRDQVYDVTPEAWKLYLGKHLKYSCCLFTDESCTLEQAEVAMLKLYCERAQIQDGQTILDLGGGFGCVALYIAEHFPSCHITSMAYSKCQTEHIQVECRKRGLSNVTAIDCNIEDFKTSEKFDRIFAIQFFEHVKNCQSLLKTISSYMKADALLFIEHWCHKHFAYNVGKEAAPGVLGENLLLYFQEDVTIINQWRLNGTHQGRTSEAFVKNIDTNFEAIRSIYAKACGEENATKMVISLRNNFLIGSEMFNFNNGGEWIVSHKLFTKK